jgi:hypothetical protein
MDRPAGLVRIGWSLRSCGTIPSHPKAADCSLRLCDLASCRRFFGVQERVYESAPGRAELFDRIDALLLIENRGRIGCLFWLRCACEVVIVGSESSEQELNTPI